MSINKCKRINILRPFLKKRALNIESVNERILQEVRENQEVRKPLYWFLWPLSIHSVISFHSFQILIKRKLFSKRKVGKLASEECRRAFLLTEEAFYYLNECKKEVSLLRIWKSAGDRQARSTFRENHSVVCNGRIGNPRFVLFRRHRQYRTADNYDIFLIPEAKKDIPSYLPSYFRLFIIITN